jgi:hypothetical protein
VVMFMPEGLIGGIPALLGRFVKRRGKEASGAQG